MVVFIETIPAALTTAVFLIALGLAAYSDKNTRTIPNGICAVILLTAATACFTIPGIDICARLSGLVCVSAPMFLLALFIPGAFGGGDIKLMAVGGAFLGWRLTVTAAVIAVVCTGGWCGIMIAAGKRNRKGRFALGPFLCLGMLAVVLAGDKIAII